MDHESAIDLTQFLIALAVVILVMIAVYEFDEAERYSCAARTRLLRLPPEPVSLGPEAT